MNGNAIFHFYFRHKTVHKSNLFPATLFSSPFTPEVALHRQTVSSDSDFPIHHHSRPDPRPNWRFLSQMGTDPLMYAFPVC
jgi:hypothetical protein